MVSNINQFIAETNKEIEALQKKQISEAKQIVLTAYKTISELSPVDTGLFKANNFLTVNSQANYSLISMTKKEYGVPHTDTPEYKENVSEIKELKFKHNDSIYIQNNLQYADALEAGHSKQAVGGVYGITEDKIKQLLKRTTLI